MKIIFLDIDGVLAVNHRRRDQFGSLFHPQFVRNLGMILECVDAGIVITSSWRKSGLIQMEKLWKARRLPGKILDTTPSIYGSEKLVHFYNGYESRPSTKSIPTYGVPRGIEIEYWLSLQGFHRINWDASIQREYVAESGIENYVILDDDSDFLYGQREHYVPCSRQSEPDAVEGYGLTEAAAHKAVQILTTDLIELYYPTASEIIN